VGYGQVFRLFDLSPYIRCECHNYHQTRPKKWKRKSYIMWLTNFCVVRYITQVYVCRSFKTPTRTKYYPRVDCKVDHPCFPPPSLTENMPFPQIEQWETSNPYNMHHSSNYWIGEACLSSGAVLPLAVEPLSLFSPDVLGCPSPHSFLSVGLRCRERNMCIRRFMVLAPFLERVFPHLI
jgi:hypothetical protein